MNKKLYCTVSDGTTGNQYLFQIFRNATSPKQWHLQIDVLDVCRSLESTLVVGRLHFELHGCEVKIWSLSWFWDCTYFESSIVVAWRIWWKKKKEKKTFAKSLFLKTNLSPICYDIINKITISHVLNVRFQNIFHQKWAENCAI